MTSITSPFHGAFAARKMRKIGMVLSTFISMTSLPCGGRSAFCADRGTHPSLRLD
jgi:hypothetical protein